MGKPHISAIKMWRTCPDSPNTRTRAHGGTHIKDAAFGRLHKGGAASGFLYMGSTMGTGSRIWAVWAGSPHFHCAALMYDFAYGFPHGYAPEPIELPLGTIDVLEDL